MKNTVDGSFTIELGGYPITNVMPHARDTDGEDQYRALIGLTDPAVFTLREGRLESGDYFLGRSRQEFGQGSHHTLYWFKKTSRSSGIVYNPNVSLSDDEDKIYFGGNDKPTIPCEVMRLLTVPEEQAPIVARVEVLVPTHARKYQ